MREIDPSRGVVRFSAFEVDFREGEVRKHGFRIRLQDQPFHILQILLEHPGELVTREELQRQVWPADTFVDFEKGLNNAIRKLRDALGDSAETPHYIETLPRRGYRWVGPAEPMHPRPTNLAAVVPINSSAVPHETYQKLAISPFRQLALIQTLFFIPSIRFFRDVSWTIMERPESLVLMRPWIKLLFGTEAAVFIAGSLFTGLSALNLWRGDLGAVRLFCRSFVLYLFFDVLFVQIMLSFLIPYIREYAFVLLPVLVLLPFYQKRLALRILALEPQANA